MTVESVGASLARQGLQSMFAPGVRQIQDQVRLGDTYMGQITWQSTDPIEKAVTEVGLRAVKDAESGLSRLAISEVTLEALAAGVSGPISDVLASIAKSAMGNPLVNVQDRASIGCDYVAAEACRGDAAQQIVAQAGLAANPWLQSDEARITMDRAVLDACHGSSNQPVAGLVAQAGYESISSPAISNMQDRAVIGVAFVGAVRDHTPDANVKAQAEAALDAANLAVDTRARADILGSFLRSVPGTRYNMCK